MRSVLLLLSWSLLCQYSFAQERPAIKFGRISATDFAVASPLIDSNVNAVVLADIGTTQFIGDNRGSFNIEFRRHKRIKILNRKGFDAGEVVIRQYQSNKGKELVTNLKAFSYNLEGDKVRETKLDSKSIFEEKESERIKLTKFAMPDLKEGTIIEYTYTIVSDFIFELQPWAFQGAYPCLWSEYEVAVPDYFDYVFLSQGYLNFHQQSKERLSGSFQLSPGALTLTPMVSYMKWVIKDAPPLNMESFTSTIGNHISKIEFQLSKVRFPNSPEQEILSSWTKVAEELMTDDYFGLSFTRSNGWLDDELKPILGNETDPLEKAKKMYHYIRENFTTTGAGYKIKSGTSLKEVYKRKNGNVAELNLLLLTMLRHEKIHADPVLLSTKGNGFANNFYPLMNRYNYVVISANINGRNYLLDPTEKMGAFGKLDYTCYNGQARVITKDNATAIYLSADSLEEKSYRSVHLFPGEQGKWKGNSTYFPGYYESIRLRDKLKGISDDAVKKTLAKDFALEVGVSDVAIDSLNVVDFPLKLQHAVEVNLGDDDILYVNPFFIKIVNENPFKSEVRNYPVEMPYKIDENFTVMIGLPEGYAVDEMPKSTKINLFEADGFFEYLIKKYEDNIQVRVRLKINKANFSNEDYEVLREFFMYVIKKQGEQIVLKKVK